jgi:predicted O-methyltransferase YrrM
VPQVSLEGLAERAGNDPAFADLVARVDATGVQTWLKERERALLFGIGAFAPGEGVIVEIGSWHGSSACHFAGGIMRRGTGRLICVDPLLGGPPWLGLSPERGTRARFHEVTQTVGVAGVIDLRVGESGAVSAVWPGTPIDAVFIDGDHSFKGALRDVECWAPKLRPGGLVLIDDADDPALPGVLELIELVKTLTGVTWVGTLDGFAVFQRDDSSSWLLLADLETKLAPRGIHRSWDMAGIGEIQMTSRYMRSRTWSDEGLSTAYELCFLARCGAGPYAYSPGIDEGDRALLNALSSDREDGDVVSVDSRPVACRAVLTTREEAVAQIPLLQPGGVMIVREPSETSDEQVFATHLVLEKAGLDGCGWHQQTHWGIKDPHLLSSDAVLDFALAAASLE